MKFEDLPEDIRLEAEGLAAAMPENFVNALKELVINAFKAGHLVPEQSKIEQYKDMEYTLRKEKP